MKVEQLLSTQYVVNNAKLLNKNFNSNKNIENINIIEVPNHLYTIGKNCLILINSYIFEHNNISILDTIDILNKKNICALGIVCTKTPIDNLNINLNKIDGNFDFPILIFPKNITYKDIIENISPDKTTNKLFLEQININLNALKNSDFFTMDNILNLLLAYTEKPILLFSEEFRILNYVKQEQDTKKRIIPMDKIYQLITSNINSKYSFSNQIIFHDHEYYILYPLKVPQKNLGFLCLVLHDKEENNKTLNELANIAIPHIIINKLTYHKGEIMYQKSKEEFIHNLLYGLYPDENFIKAQAEKLQFKYDQKLFVWILHAQPLSKVNTSASVQSTIPNKVMNKILNIVKSRYPDNYHLIDNKGIVLIQKKDDTPDSVHRKNCNLLIQQLEIYLPEYKFLVGISRAYEPITQLKNAYNDAVFSLKIGSEIFKGSKNIYPYNDLILYHLIYSLKDNPIIERIYNITIKRILEYDEEHNAKLFQTLKVLTDLDFNITESSQTLYIHRNTLYKRMDRIEEATGYSLDNSQTRLLFHLGLKIHDIYILSE